MAMARTGKNGKTGGGGDCGKCGAGGDKHIARNNYGQTRCYECRTGKPLPDPAAAHPEVHARLQAQVDAPRMSAAHVAELVDAMYGPAS